MTTTVFVRSQSGERAVSIPEGAPLREALRGERPWCRASCGGIGTCGRCRVRVLNGAAPPPTRTESEHLSTAELAQGVRLACQLRLTGDATVERVPPPPPPQWQTIPPSQLQPIVAPPWGSTGDLDPRFGVAVDLGTSQIRVALWDRRRGVRVGTLRGPNPQETWGVDVLRRLSAARERPGLARRLGRLPRAAILRAVRRLIDASAGTEGGLGEVGRLVVVGNTAMLILACEGSADVLLDPEAWSRRVDPIKGAGGHLAELWGMPAAEAILAQPLCGFVGSDLLAAVLATRLSRGPAGALLVDFGTNTELALWDGATLHVTSVAGGPAFAESAGRFASVLVSAAARELEMGRLKPSGRWVGASSSSAGGPSLRPASVDALQQAKAATAVAVLELLARAGMDGGSIERVCLCGTLSQHLDVAHAIAIGLLPALPLERFELHPHAVLAGCEEVLMSPDGESLLAAIARPASAINLATLPGWDDRFIGQLPLAPIPMGEGRRRRCE